MPQDEGQAGGETPGEHATEGPDETGLAGPERDDRASRGGAPTGVGEGDAGDVPVSTEEGTQRQEQIIETARRMAEGSPKGQVTGEDIAREVGLEPDDPALAQALKVGSERGDLACQGWHGDSGLPTRVHAGAQPGAASEA